MTGTSDLGPMQIIADTVELPGNVSMTMNFQSYVDGGVGDVGISLIE